jgi:hypothetical protein
MCGYECLGPNAYQNSTITDEFILKRALHNLRRTDCVGVTERLDDLIDQLKYNLRWVPNRYQAFPRANKLGNAFKSVLDDEAEAILRKWAWVDDRLYKVAVTIADRKTTAARRCYSKVHG